MATKRPLWRQLAESVKERFNPNAYNNNSSNFSFPGSFRTPSPGSQPTEIATIYPHKTEDLSTISYWKRASGKRERPSEREPDVIKRMEKEQARRIKQKQDGEVDVSVVPCSYFRTLNTVSQEEWE